jgi:hypothetical protein
VFRSRRIGQPGEQITTEEAGMPANTDEENRRLMSTIPPDPQPPDPQPPDTRPDPNPPPIPTPPDPDTKPPEPTI